MHQNELKYKSIGYTWRTIYSRPFVFILVLFGLIFFSGGSCFKQIEAAYWPVSGRPAALSEKAGNPSSKTGNLYKHTAVDVITKDHDKLPGQSVLDIKKGESCEKKYQGSTCPPLHDTGIFQHNLYKDKLLYALDGIKTFTKEKKIGIEHCVVRLTPDAITALDNVKMPFIEVLEGIWEQLALDKKLANECPICFEHLPYRPTALPCNPAHAFHRSCIQKWIYSEVPPPSGLCRWFLKWFYLLKPPTCPLCRQNFNPDSIGLLAVSIHHRGRKHVFSSFLGKCITKISHLR